MPHVEGFGRIDLDLVGESREELMRISRVQEGYWADRIKKGQPPTPEETPFTFCPETDRTWVSLMFQPDEEIPEFGDKSVSTFGSSAVIPHQLKHFRKLLSLTEGSNFSGIVFTSVDQGIRVSFFVKGRIRSPDGLMKSITRRLRGYEPEEEIPEKKMWSPYEE